MKFSKIKNISKGMVKDIYHLTVEKNHNFFGNNICLHNCDYYDNPNNDGNIAICMYNYGETPIHIRIGDRFAQGIIIKIVHDADEKNSTKRTGGMGSTGV